MNFWLVLLLFITSSSYVCSKITENTTLEFVHVIFRHGARTPRKEETYPNDPYSIKDFEPQEYDQLTFKGKQQVYQLGTMLRERYNDILNKNYSSDLILAVTTTYDWSKMSTLIILQALFPTNELTNWYSSINWQLFPYHDDKFEYVTDLLRASRHCPAYMRELQSANSDFHNIKAPYRNILEYLSNHTGREIKSLLDAFILFSVFDLETSADLTLPDWVQFTYPQPLSDLADLYFHFTLKTTIMKRLYGGRLLKVMINNMIEKSLGTLHPASRKMHLFGEHGKEVAAILTVLNIFPQSHYPDFCSTVAIELHRSSFSNQHYVKVIYFKNADAKPEELIVPGCDILCPLEEFKQLTSQYIPGNYTEECESNVLLD